MTIIIGSNTPGSTINGTSAGNIILAGSAGNVINGAGGADTILGGAGNDTINGGEGADLLFGRGGADTFVFSSATEANGDSILDFSVAQGDRLNLSAIGTFQIQTVASATGQSFPANRLVFETSTNSLLGFVAGGTVPNFTIGLFGVSSLTATAFTGGVTDAPVGDAVPPIVNPGQTFNYLENRIAGSVLGTVIATDNVAVTGFNIVSGNPSGFYSIAANGQITLTAAGAAAGVASNDFETLPNQFVLGVTASDAAGNTSAPVNVTLNVNDLDDTPPVLVSSVPADNATGVAVNANLVLTFNEAVTANGVVTFDAPGTADDRTVTLTPGVASTVLTIDPPVDLAPGVAYDVLIANGVIRDVANNPFAGFVAGQLNFSTAAAGFTTVNLDNQGALGAPVTLNAGTGAFNYIDTVAQANNVIINNFGADDQIDFDNTVLPVFQSGTPTATDITITANNNGVVSSIVLPGAFPAGSPLVFDLTTFNNLPIGNVI